jgi:hypothetical protein
MAKLLTDRTKDEMIGIKEYVIESLNGLKYKGKNFIGCELIIKIVGETPIYELTILQETPNDLIFEADDFSELIYKVNGFIKALK